MSGVLEKQSREAELKIFQCPMLTGKGLTTSNANHA